MSEAPEVLNVAEAAAYLRLSVSTIRRMINSNELHAASLRGQLRVRRADLDELLTRRLPSHGIAEE